ncbi:hypothetical protein, partial [Polaribacter atrinae]|uniref:hypothetical protein n=1 Tax=Polaribacter atrinae TaxID=1333662 RepID=UPI0030F8D0C0
AGGSSDPQSSVTIPNSVAFIRATVRTSELDTLQFEKGTSTTYEEYKEKIDNSKLDIEGFTIGEAEEGNTNPVSGDTLYKEIQLIKSEKGDDVFTFSLRTDVIKGIDNVLDTNDFSTPLRLKPSNVQFFEKGKKIEMDYSYKNVGKNYSLTLRSEYTHLDVEVVVLANKFISPERPTILSDGNTTMLIDSTDVDSMDITTEGRVIKWYDSINGVNLVQNIVTELSPIYTEDCILFKGDENLFSTFDTTETQNVYITYRIKKFIPTQFIFDGYTRNSASLRTNYQEDEVRLGDVSLPIQEGTEDDIHIVRMFIDGENSSYRLNNQLIKATDVGDLNMGGIVLGRPGDDDFEFEVYEVIVRKGIDSEATSDEIYTYLKDKYQVNESTYDTLAEAVYYEEPSNIKLGNVIFNKTATEPINCGKGFDFKSKKIEDAYEMVGNNGIMNHSLENPELIRFVENSINCFVFSMSDKHIYYGHGRAFYRINKHTMLDKVGFTITGALDGGVGSSTGADQITMVTETNDGNLLIQLDNNAPNSNFYKFKGTDATSGSVIYTPEDAKLVLVVNSRKVIAEGAWGMTQKDNRVFMIVYAARGQAYLSEDYGDTFKCVFSMADSAINEAVDEVDEVFVDTKPDGYGSYGKKGGHPMKDTLTNPVDFDLWGTTLNGNLHSHGGCIDPYADRLIIVTGDGAPAVGVFYSDDWGYTWTMINTQGVLIPSSDFSAQFNTVIPLKDSIIFGCDGMGDGYWRVFRDGNKLMDKVENCYQFNGESTLLVTISGGHYFHKDGTFFGIINPEADDDYNNVKGGIVATKNGHNFTKLYEDSFTLPDKATSEFAWRGLLTVNDNNEMLVSAKNGGIIKLDLVTTYNL